MSPIKIRCLVVGLMLMAVSACASSSQNAAPHGKMACQTMQGVRAAADKAGKMANCPMMRKKTGAQGDNAHQHPTP